MGAGLELFNTVGNPILKITDDVGRFLNNSIYVNANSSGSIDVPEFQGAQGFSLCVADNGGGEPDVTISGRTLSWLYRDNGNNAYPPANTTIYYGAFG